MGPSPDGDRPDRHQAMVCIDFLLSNDRHHAAMLGPLVEILAREHGHRCRVLSLCELRGLRSPRELFDFPNTTFHRLLPGAIGRARNEGASEAIKSGPRRLELARSLLWGALLAPRLAALWARRPAVVVTPNDAAYPYDRVVTSLNRRGIPFVLLQEGIRFSLPGVPMERFYGAAGARAIAAWGESSAEYFRSAGADESTIHLTGCPRFDRIVPGSQKRRSGEQHRLLLLTNPIDDQGFCSSDEKHELVRAFVDGIEPLVARGELEFALKLHSGESRDRYHQALASSPVLNRIEFVTDAPLYPLLETADAVVVMASTVGLEALLHQRSLGVLELPGIGFVFDYVSEGVALGLTWDQPMARQIEELLGSDTSRTDAYLSRHLAVMGESTEAVASLVSEIAEGDRPGR